MARFWRVFWVTARVGAAVALVVALGAFCALMLTEWPLWFAVPMIAAGVLLAMGAAVWIDDNLRPSPPETRTSTR